MSRCIIIGGAGFIGLELTRMLCASGRKVFVLGRRSVPDVELPSNCNYVCGDYGNRTILREIMMPGCEVIDLAYSTVPKTSYGDPVFDLISNLPPSVGLLQEAQAAGVKKVLLVSSGGTVYGSARSLPITEDHPTIPLSPYGITKLTIDRYAMMFHRTMDMPVVIARPANAYGENQRARSGQGFIAAAIDAVLCGRNVDVYGEEGTIRDYIHVSDIASGILSILNDGVAGEAYNIGTGLGTSNLALLSILESTAAESGHAVHVNKLPARRFDVDANVLDCRKLKELSNWSPKISLHEGVKKMWLSAVNIKKQQTKNKV